MRTSLLAVLLLLAGPARAAETGAFLKLNAGPRPIGLGEAFTPVADDLNAQTINPAGLAQLSMRELGFSHAELYSDTKLDSLAFAHPLSQGRGTLAVGVLRLSHGAIAARDSQGREAGSFEASDTAVQAAFGRSFSGLGMLGVNVKYLESKLAYATARGFAADVGLLKPLSKGWTVGAAVQNLGQGLKYAQEESRLPLAVAGGASVRLAGALLLTAEVKHRPYGGGLSAGVGTEYNLLPSLAIRGGYRSAGPQTGPDAGGLPAASGLGLGFGVKLKKASLDYAFSPQGELGQTQRFSLSTRW